MEVLCDLPVHPGCSLDEVVTAHGWYEVAPFSWKPQHGELHRVDRVSGRPFLVRVRQLDPTRLQVVHDSEDPGAPDRMARVLSLEFPGLAGFQEACRGHGSLSWVADQGAGRFLRGLDAWEDASKAVCFTNIQWSQAARCLNALSEAGPGFCGIRCWPDPEELLAKGQQWMRAHGRIGYRTPFLWEIAQGFVSGRFSRTSFSRESFAAMPGIGPATSAYLAGMWGDWTCLSFDSSIAAMLRDREGIEHPRPRDARDLYSTFGSFEGLACLLDVSGYRRGIAVERPDP